MKDTKIDLNKAARGPRWKRILFTLGVNVLLLAKHLADFYLYLNYHFPRRRFFLHTQPRAHYIGYPRQQPHRLAFWFLGAVVITTAILISDVNQSMLWITGWGLVFSVWVTTQSFARVLKRIRS